jgi:hypothetical protein
MITLPVPAETALPTSHTQLTPDRQALFLRKLADWGNVRSACKAAGIGRTNAYRMRRSSSEFAELWDGALLLARSQAEDVLADRALNGVEEKVFYHGEEVATRRRFSPQLLLAHLGRLDKLSYRPAARDAADAFDSRVGRLEAGVEEESYQEMIARESEEGGDLCGDLSGDWPAEDAEMEELARMRGNF